MNKKLFSGLALMSVAATAFWACGEGNINGKDLNDDIAMASNEQDLQTLKDNAIEDCRITPDCYLKYQGYLEGTDVPSSVDNPTSSASLTPQSSNSLIIPGMSSSIKIARSSSSINIIDNPVESSSGAAPITDDTFGTCAVDTTKFKVPINKGTSVQWKFTANSKYPGFDALKIAKATYDWSFAADAVDDGSGKGTLSGNITYPNSGPTTASVTVTYDGTPITVACLPLQVNGAAITCTCESAVISPYDFTSASGATVTWTATCSSAGANITGYQWSGAEGTSEIGSYTFTDETTVAPKVTVSNDDNSVQEFECPAVKGTNGPENEFDLATATDEQKALQQGVTYTVKHPYSSAIQFNGSSADCTVEVNGEAVEVSHYKAIQPAPASPVVVKPINCTATIGGY